MADIKICLACNEDGFGPSAFGFYILKALLAELATRGADPLSMDVTALNNSARNFNAAVYSRPLSGVIVKYPAAAGADSLIRLEKNYGEVHVAKTLASLSRYEVARTAYAEKVASFLEGADLAVDIGVPLFVRAAAMARVPRRVTVFDHAWSETLRLAAAPPGTGDVYKRNPPPAGHDREQARKIAALIGEDEALATSAHLFPRCIAPDEFRRHWKRLSEIARRRNASEGGPLELTVHNAAMACSDDIRSGAAQGRARRTLNEMLEEEGQKGVDFDDPRRPGLALLSPGGTPVWEERMSDIVQAFLKTNRPGFIPVVSNIKARDQAGNDIADDLKQMIRERGQGKIAYIGFVKGNTQQAVMPAFDLVVTRAGGGTVNDCLAAGVPMAFIGEPQVQVMLIEKACREDGLVPGPAVELADFASDPVSVMSEMYTGRDRCLSAIGRVDIGMEREIARALADSLLGAEADGPR